MSLILGLLKGALIGGGLGYGFMQLGFGGGGTITQYLLYGVIGGVVGLVAGKPFWRHQTFWTPLLKVIFGVAIAIGLYALVAKVLGDPKLAFMGAGMTATKVPYLLGAAIGVVYGVFVEVDDGGKSAKEKEDTPAR